MLRAGLLLVLLLVATAAGGASCPEDSLPAEESGRGQASPSCRCIPSSLCPRHECPDEMQLVRVRDAVPETPGSCCPLYECRNQATLSYDPSEESLHQCLDEQGQPREVGEHWTESDPCTSCVCEPGGRPRCHVTMCRSCPKPLPRAANECCPRCPSEPSPPQSGRPDCPRAPECPLDCPHGRLRDADDCELCQCRPLPECPPRLACRPPRRCPAGFRSDPDTGCPVCQCLDGCLDEDGAPRLEAERWSRGPCRSCLCSASGAVSCNDTVCSLGCPAPLPPPPGQCCPLCPPQEGAEDGVRGGGGGWGTVPVVLIAVLGLLCVVLMVHLVRGRFRGRLHPRGELDFAGYQAAQQQQPQQYYKCVPVYEPVLRHAEKIVAL